MWIKTNNGIKLIPLLLGLCALTSLPPPLVYASEIPPANTTSTEDELLAAAASLEPAVFSVTVPTSLPIYADEYGNITVATNAAIVNNGNSSVKVTNLGITQTGPFNIADFDEDFRYKYLDAFEFAMNINGSKTQSNGSINFDASGFPAIPAGSSQLLNYSAKVTGTSTDMEDVHVTDVCLTLDWNAPVTITYNARGGTFADGTSVNTVTYTQEGKVISGTMADPTKPNCEFVGWYTDTSFSQQFTGSTTSTTVYARYRVPYTIEYAWQSLDNSHTYLLHESQSLMGLENEVVWPEVRTYDQYKNPRQQSFTVVENGVFRYNYDRTTYWLDVNYIANGTYTGGPDDWSTWPSGLSSNFLSVYINGAYSGGGRDYCKTQPFESYYEIVLDLPEDFYYLGTFNEGVDKWNNGTVLYRKPDHGNNTENVGKRVIINSLTDSTARYYIAFDPNGGEGSMNQMTMAFESGGSEIDWLNKNAFSREGYTFGGWMTTPDGDTAQYSDDQKVSGLSSTDGETITLYALWIPNSPLGLIEDEASETEDTEETDVPGNEENEEAEDEETDTPQEDENPEEPSEDETPKEPDEDEEVEDENNSENPDESSPPDTPSTPEEPVPPSEEPPETPPEDTNPEDTPSDTPDNPSEPSETPESSDKPESPELPGDDENTSGKQDSPTPPETPEDDTLNEGTDGEELDKDDEEDEELDEPVIEPVYYCNLEIHVHGEDCSNAAACEEIEHEHEASCLVPQPPEEPEPPEETPEDSNPDISPDDNTQSSDTPEPPDTDEPPAPEVEPETPVEPPSVPQETPPAEEPIEPPVVETTPPDKPPEEEVETPPEGGNEPPPQEPKPSEE